MKKTQVPAKPRIAAAWCLHDDLYYLDLSSNSFAGIEQLAFVSRFDWSGGTGDWEATARLAESLGMRVVLGDWPNEEAHRCAALNVLKSEGYSHVFIPDGDEVLSPELFDRLLSVAIHAIADRVHVQMDTYWKSREFVIRPRERIEPVILVNPQKTHHVHCRQYAGGSSLTLDASHGVMHHLSYCGPDERIRRKISTWGHKDEVQQGWYENVWVKWDSDPLLRNIHPTHPAAYGFAERIEVPEILRRKNEPLATGNHERPAKWPSVSVVIPVLDNLDDIRLCLESLRKSADLIHELVVVDNGSSTPTKEYLSSQPGIKLLRNEINLGFGIASNQGVETSSGEVILFLNADTVVPRSGLYNLVSALEGSGSIGASGPVSNHVGYYQRVDSTYTDLAHLDLFADHWASLPSANQDVDMLVGFCLAVKRHVLEETGLFDTRFGVGLFEDTDLCYRIQRSGYRLIVARRAFVHHTGSQTISKVSSAPFDLLAQNSVVFRGKWRSDVDSGFATHLPGGEFPLGPVRFDRSKDPQDPNSEVGVLRRQADVSLCMIVRNEERVLADCLESAKPFFNQIVVIDTGSTDRTVEIAQSFGVELHQIEWPDSFAEARNESLRHATGKWVFWIDADDTVPWQTGMSVLKAAMEAPPNIAGFVVPVQFVDDGPSGGTRVDHVKLFRNLPGVFFEGRIHEQVLASLRPHGDIARMDAVVLHSGYDTSVQGQANKRERDFTLLELDLRDRPEHPFVLFNLGMTHHFCGNHEVAVSWLEQCLDKAQPHESHVRKAYALLGLSLKKLGDTSKAEAAFIKGLDVVGPDPELSFHLGMLCAEQGRWEDAKRHYKSVDGDLGQVFSSVDVGILGFKRHFNLGSVYLNLGDYDSAKEEFAACLRLAPHLHDAAKILFEESLRRGDFATSKGILEHIVQNFGFTELWAELQFELIEAVDSFDGAVLHFYALLGNPERTNGIKPVLTRALLRAGRISEGVPLAADLAESGRAEFAYYVGVAQIRTGNLEQAKAWLLRARQLNPEHLDTNALLAQLGVNSSVENFE